MRYEIDKKNGIVDFYIEDDSGREHHAGLSFAEFRVMVLEIAEAIGDIDKIDYE